MDECKYLECLYNEDGRCNYENSNLKLPYVRACNDVDFVEDYEPSLTMAEDGEIR